MRLFRLAAVDLYDLVNVTQDVIDAAASLAERYVLRGYDAVQVASARSVQRALAPEPVTLLSADRRMCEIARDEGMDVIDPTDAAR
ncbi:MAG: type II toxin-antitoxin system VapC family toxin [Candidatus Poribacteria bacterium]